MKKKVVLITGASGGIGSSLVKKFANNGYNVVMAYNSSNESITKIINELQTKSLSVCSYKADLRDYNQIKSLIDYTIKTYGKIDVLINNAGISQNSLLIDESDDNILNIINVNLLGTIYCTKYASKQMLSNGGKIINISSIWGQCGACMESVYSASKAGVITFTRAMAKELSSANITVNCIAPGIVETKMMNAYSNQEKKDLKEQIPLERFAKPEEIANLSLFLASTDADYITGQTITIDGGFTL